MKFLKYTLILLTTSIYSQNIGDFTSVVPSGQTDKFVIPSTHRFQSIIQVGDPLTAGGTLPIKTDFSGYVPISSSSTNGYLSINSENDPGGNTVLDINFNASTHLWETTASEAIDFSVVGGTWNNCSGTVTPWGTIISSEEIVLTSDSNGDSYNDSGWNVEIDPVTKTIVNNEKLWALGNFKHENISVHSNLRTVYEGADDSAGDGFLYKFVANSAQDLSSGDLYVYTGSKNGTGSWVLINDSSIPAHNLPAHRNNTIALSNTAGATLFAGIEDVEIGPDGWIYFSVKNPPDERVYRFQDSNTLETTASVVTMETFVGGMSYNIFDGTNTTSVSWGTGNDNLAFDGDGNLWVLQDGSDNYIWVVKNGHTQASPDVELFGIAPTGAEPTGITFTPDYKYLFMSIQHPSPGNSANQIDASGIEVDFDRGTTLVIALEENIGSTTLSAGDIAITGFNSDNPDEFSFVLLTDVLYGTEINFTDLGWRSSGVFYTEENGGYNEGVITWVADSDLTCGTEIIIENIGSSTFSSTVGTASQTDAGFLLSTTGDQILAYQGTLAAPTFIHAVHFDGTSGWSANATSTNTSALPSGLTNGVNAVAIDEIDNGKYNCAVTNNRSLILAAVSDSKNWIRNNSILNPLGGCSYTCGDCPTIVTWDGTSWDAPPTSTTFAIMDGNYTATSANSFSACSLYINAISTSTSNPVIVRVDNGGYIEVESDVVVDGTLIVETSGNFVQRGNTGTFTVNTGGVSRVNKTTPSKTDWFFYTYWSSPVENETVEDAFPLVDTDRRFWFNAANFLDTDGDDIDDDANDWQIAFGAMTPGVGYASTEARLFFGGAGSASFEGPFNTGDIGVTISENPANAIASWNFIGNPYASAIDFDAFHAANSTVVDGAVYFWSQVSPPDELNNGNEQKNFNNNDYAIYTVASGGVVAGAGGIMPDQYIPSGQGFFIAGLIDGGTATFTNAMRMADATSNNQFFKNSNSKKKTVSTNANRIWVNLTSNNGVFSQILLAYVTGATNGNDGLSYDAPKLVSEESSTILYSLMDADNKKYVIQGKNIDSINEDEIISLGFNTTAQTNTQYKLSIAQLEGAFLTNKTVYIKDNLLNTLHNLSVSDYTFTSEVGEFNERFEIVFNANALSTEDVDVELNTLKIIELDDDRVKFTASTNIKTVRIFDLLGRQLYDFKGQSNSETYKLSNLSSAIYIAKVELSNGAIITKKAIKR